jgi:hypothetical protein
MSAEALRADGRGAPDLGDGAAPGDPLNPSSGR